MYICFFWNRTVLLHVRNHIIIDPIIQWLMYSIHHLNLLTQSVTLFFVFRVIWLTDYALSTNQKGWKRKIRNKDFQRVRLNHLFMRKKLLSDLNYVLFRERIMNIWINNFYFIRRYFTPIKLPIRSKTPFIYIYIYIAKYFILQQSFTNFVGLHDINKDSVWNCLLNVMRCSSSFLLYLFILKINNIAFWIRSVTTTATWPCGIHAPWSEIQRETFDIENSHRPGNHMMCIVSCLGGRILPLAPVDYNFFLVN